MLAGIHFRRAFQIFTEFKKRGIHLDVLRRRKPLRRECGVTSVLGRGSKTSAQAEFISAEHFNVSRNPKKKDILLDVLLFWSGRRGSNSPPASHEWPPGHSQEPCRTSDLTCLRHRWRQRVRPSTDKKRTPKLGCPLKNGAGDEARTRYRHPTNGLPAIRRNPAGSRI